MGLSTNIPNELYKLTPTRRNSVYDLIKASPGVSSEDPSGRSSFISVVGSSADENKLLVDGADTTRGSFNIGYANVDPDIVQEIELVALGASASTGNALGGIVNVVTKSGGNDFHGDVSYFNQSDRFASKPVKNPCNCPAGETGYVRDKYNDFTAHVGGPIVRNHAWFFGGGQVVRDFDSQPGTNPAFPFPRKNEKGFVKVTWNLSNAIRLAHSVHRDSFETLSAVATVANPVETRQTRSGADYGITYAHLNHVLTNRTAWELRVSGSPQDSKFVPNLGYDRLWQTDLATGLSSAARSGSANSTHERQRSRRS